MLIAATSLPGQPIMDFSTREPLGKIERCLYDPDRGMLVAFLVKLDRDPKQLHYIIFSDVQSFTEHTVIVNKANFVPLDQINEVETTFKKRPVLGQRAETTSHKPLGKVNQLMIHDMTGQIMQLHTQLLLSKRIFSFEDVVKVTSRAVVFRNDIDTATEPTPVMA